MLILIKFRPSWLQALHLGRIVWLSWRLNLLLDRRVCPPGTWPSQGGMEPNQSSYHISPDIGHDGRWRSFSPACLMKMWSYWYFHREWQLRWQLVDPDPWNGWRIWCSWQAKILLIWFHNRQTIISTCQPKWIYRDWQCLWHCRR